MRKKNEFEEILKREHRLFRAVFFSNDKGKLVFAMVLDKLCHFKEAENDRERYLKDFATVLLNIVGEGGAYEYVNALSKIRDREQHEEKDNG